jgi:hypothetical protein
MAPASGLVLYQGKPVEGAQVVFHNDRVSRMPGGTTDAQGKFRLTTFENFDGAILGDYKVSVTKVAANPELAGASVDNPTAAYEAGMTAAASGNKEAIAKEELPGKYADPNTSELTATVTKEGPNEFKFELE